MKTLCTVAVYPAGNPAQRVVIPDIECEPDKAGEAAKAYVHLATVALDKVGPGNWRTTVLSQTEVEDIKEKTQ